MKLLEIIRTLPEEINKKVKFYQAGTSELYGKVKEIPQPYFNSTTNDTSETYTPFVEEPIVVEDRVVLENTIVEYPKPTTVQPTVIQPTVQTEMTTDKEVLDLRLRILQVIESIFRIVLD